MTGLVQRAVIAVSGTIHVVKKPEYLGGALLAATAMLFLLVWLFNVNFFWWLWADPSLGTFDKLGFLSNALTTVLANALVDLRAFGMILVSILVGINVALVVYIVKMQKKLSKKKHFGGMLVALLGSGCVACGGSILSPVVTTIGSGNIAALSNIIGLIAYPIAAALLIRSIYKLGQSAYHINVLGKQI